MLHKQVTMLEQGRDLRLESLLLAGGLLGGPRRRTPAVALGQGLLELPPHGGQGFEHLTVDLLEDVELADLMRDARKDLGQRLRVQRRTIGGDPSQRQIPSVQFAGGSDAGNG